MVVKPINLRGVRVTFANPGSGKMVRGVVITRIRGTRWLIQSPQLPRKFARNWFPGCPKRIVLERNDFQLEIGQLERRADPDDAEPTDASSVRCSMQWVRMVLSGGSVQARR